MTLYNAPNTPTSATTPHPQTPDIKKGGFYTTLIYALRQSKLSTRLNKFLTLIETYERTQQGL